MKKFNFLFSLVLLLTQLFQGCSNPIENVTAPTGNHSASESITAKRLNNVLLKFYIWKLAPHGYNPAISGAYVDIYKGSVFIKRAGVTDANGQISMETLSLQPGIYTVVAYTLVVGNNIDYYGIGSLNYNNSSLFISICVEHV